MITTIIGAGNLGTSIALGLLKTTSKENIIVTRKSKKPNILLEKAGISILSDNANAIQNAEIIIIAVKPFKVEEVLQELKMKISDNQIIISVATGISIEDIKSTIGNKTIFRAMPNTASSVGESMTCIAQTNASENQIDKVIAIFDTLGETILIEENLMNASTVLGACGIAYVMRFVRAMVQGGIEIGFDSKTANKITNQTIKGAIELLLQNGLHPEEEIDKVTTPKGCTIAGLNEMEHQGFSSSMIKGIKTSFDKI